MLEDETVEPYVRWSNFNNREALLIPDIDAFVANVMPRHFKEMKKWGSFQRQLNNYEFQRQDRGADKALYTHSRDNFCRGHPELLPYVRRRPNPQVSTCPGQERPITSVAPPADDATPESGSQTSPPSYGTHELEDQVRGLKSNISKLESDLESSKKQRSEMEGRLRSVEDQLERLEQQLLGMGIQILELSSMLERRAIGGRALNAMGGLGPAPPHNVSVPNMTAAIDVGFLPSHTARLQSASLESDLPMEVTYDPLSDWAFVAP